MIFKSLKRITFICILIQFRYPKINQWNYLTRSTMEGANPKNPKMAISCVFSNKNMLQSALYTLHEVWKPFGYPVRYTGKMWVFDSCYRSLQCYQWSNRNHLMKYFLYFLYFFKSLSKTILLSRSSIASSANLQK